MMSLQSPAFGNVVMVVVVMVVVMPGVVVVPGTGTVVTVGATRVFVLLVVTVAALAAGGKTTIAGCTVCVLIVVFWTPICRSVGLFGAPVNGVTVVVFLMVVMAGSRLIVGWVAGGTTVVTVPGGMA